MWLWKPYSWDGWEIAGLRRELRRRVGTACISESEQGAMAELMRVLRTWTTEKLSGRKYRHAKKQQKGERDGRKPERTVKYYSK